MRHGILLGLLLTFCGCVEEDPLKGGTRYEVTDDEEGYAEEAEARPPPLGGVVPAPRSLTEKSNLMMQYTPTQVRSLLEHMISDNNRKRSMAVASVPSDPGHYEKHPELLGKVREALVLVASTDTEHMNRAFAIGKLCGMGEHAKPAVPALAKLLEHERDAQHVAHHIHRLGKTGHATIPRMIELLQKGPERNKVFLVDGLANFGDAAADAIPVLTNVVDSEADTYTRLKAARALGKFGAKAESALRVLEDVAKSAPSNLKYACKDAAEAIRKG